MNLSDKVNKISFGVKYRRSFKLLNISKDIVDYILKDSNCPFGEKFFKDVAENDGGGMILFSGKGDIFSIDIDGVVLTLNVVSLEADLKKFKEIYIPYLENIFQEFDINNFQRLGMVFEHSGEEDFISTDNMISKLSDNKFNSIDNMELRFSKKLPVEESIIKKDIIDFYNSIFTFSKNSKGLTVKVDYQIYFSPEISDITDTNSIKFIDVAHGFLVNKFYTWDI